MGIFFLVAIGLAQTADSCRSPIGNETKQEYSALAQSGVGAGVGYGVGVGAGAGAEWPLELHQLQACRKLGILNRSPALILFALSTNRTCWPLEVRMGVPRKRISAYCVMLQVLRNRIQPCITSIMSKLAILLMIALRSTRDFRGDKNPHMFQDNSKLTNTFNCACQSGCKAATRRAESLKYMCCFVFGGWQKKACLYKCIDLPCKILDCASPTPFCAEDVAVAPKPDTAEVVMVRTALDTKERLNVHEPLSLSEVQPAPGDASVVVDSTVKYQTFLGFGGSFTESSADLFSKMSVAKQEHIIGAYFSRQSGLGYVLGRVHMNSCDFSAGGWSCVSEQGDTELTSFSIDRYNRSIFPMIRRAVNASGGPLKLIASPWSPPAWMKDTARMQRGGKLLPEFRDAWSRHYVRFAEEFEAAGLPIWCMTVQNEPNAVTPWENCLYTAEEERDFVRDFLGPALESSRVDVKLLVWDHNRDEMFARARILYNDAVAAKYIWGLGYHWYGDPRFEVWPDRAGQVLFDNVRKVHDLRPEKHLIMTEGCQEGGARAGSWDIGERYAEAIISDLNNWCEAWVDWNLILDTNGGPNHVSNFVSAPILVDTASDRIFFLSSYFYLAHFSRHIQPGARRVAVGSSRDALEATAFLNPDGTLVAVVLNRRDFPIKFRLQFGDRGVYTEALAHSITTYIARDLPEAAEAEDVSLRHSPKRKRQRLYSPLRQI